MYKEEEEEEGLGLKFILRPFWLLLRLEDNGLITKLLLVYNLFSSYSLNLKLSLDLEIFEL